MTILSLSDKFKQLDTNKIIQESLTETIPKFESIQKEQLSAGKTNTGDKIKPSYKRPKYAAAKNQMNPLPGLGVPDLHLTGDFYNGIDVEVSETVFDIISKDEKGPELEDKYKNIFGLGKNFKQQYLDEDLRPAVQNKITNFIGLRFN